MKKTNCIQLVLITAALAGCDKPLYQQGPEYTGPVYPPNGSAAYGSPPYGDPADSTNSCPLAQSQLPPDYYVWYDGFQPFDFYYGNWYSWNAYYAYRYPATIVRAGFGRTGHARVGFAAHS